MVQTRSNLEKLAFITCSKSMILTNSIIEQFSKKIYDMSFKHIKSQQISFFIERRKYNFCKRLIYLTGIWLQGLSTEMLNDVVEF